MNPPRRVHLIAGCVGCVLLAGVETRVVTVSTVAGAALGPPGPGRIPTGACCDWFSGNCQDDVTEDECTGYEQAWYENMLCAELDPPCEASWGACCDHATGDCWIASHPQCEGQFLEWTGGHSCGQIDCSALAVLYVDQGADGANDGSSWCDAFVQIQDALAAAQGAPDPFSEIRVADGVYKPDQGAGQTPGDRESTFQLVSAVLLYGGYAGCGADDPDARDIALYTTILSGDLNGDDQPGFINNEENAYHVVTSSGPDATGVLDGFTVTGGLADGPGTALHDLGGGVLIYEGAPTIRNCKIAGNMASMVGGGLATIDANPTISTCSFNGNACEVQAGGMFAAGPSDPSVLNCTFTGNSAFTNPAGILALGSVRVTLTSCILWGNIGSGTGQLAQIGVSGGSTLTVNYTCIQEWTGGLGGTGNIGEDPLFMDADGPDDVPGTADDDLRLSEGSPSINTGDPGFLPEDGGTDLDGQQRLEGCRVDMGPYESDTPQDLGDFNADLRIDLRDYGFLQGCFHAVGVDHEWSGACVCVFDYNGNNEVDLEDFAQFRAGMYGP